jgi:hypothetical protein
MAMIVVAVLAMPVGAQEMPKPGPEHKMLREMEGTWESTMKFGGMESKGTVTYKMELGGLWLAGSMKSEMFGQKFSGKSLDSYDAEKKKFVSVWVDSMSTAPVVMEGTYDKEKKTMSITKMLDADTQEFTMYAGDEKEPSFTILYKRKK